MSFPSLFKPDLDDDIDRSLRIGATQQPHDFDSPPGKPAGKGQKDAFDDFDGPPPKSTTLRPSTRKKLQNDFDDPNNPPPKPTVRRPPMKKPQNEFDDLEGPLKRQDGVLQ